MKDLAVIIISSNEEDVIGDCIKSCSGISDEIVVIDSNSSDNTPEIAKKHGARVIRHAFKDFSDQRNFAILHATAKWVLYVDADERLTEGFKKELEEKISNFNEDSNIGGFFINRKTFYYGKDWDYKDRVQRLFLRSRFIEWKGVVHETPRIKGEFGEIKNPILHFTHRNLSQMIRKTNKWSEYEAKLRLRADHPKLVPWRFFRVMASEFIRSYFKEKGYKNGTYGLIEALYQSFSIFITYAKLWEMQKK